MGHTIIVLIFIVFVLGLWTIAYLYHIKREYLYNFVTPFIGIIVFHNVQLMLDLVRTYLSVNIVKDDEVFKYSLFTKLSQPLTSLLTFCVIFFLIKLLLQLSEKRINAWITWTFYSIIFLYTASYIARFVFISISSDLVIVGEIHTIFEFVVANCVYLMLIYFSIKNLFGKRASRRMYNGILSTFYLAFLLLCTFPVVQSKPLYFYYMSILMSMFNIFPLIWIKYFFLPNNLKEIQSHNVNDALNSLLDEKKITIREKEIAELILKGRSNKEIEAELFISVSTVKNHIYRLFKRLGINSRGQLVNLLLERKNKNNSS